jgi:hypothetical protein
MKFVRIMAAALLLALLLTACGQAAPAAEEAKDPVDLSQLRESVEAVYPKMMEVEGEMRLDFLGIREEDCAQCVTLLCDDGMKTDELWLIEAVDDAAMERLTKLAQQRMEAKAQETESYAPDQYEIVQQGKVLTSGRYLALIVTPEAEAAAKLFDEAVG